MASRFEDLERLASLHEKGHLSDEEFQAEKDRILSGPSAATEDASQHNTETVYSTKQPVAFWNPSAAVNWSVLFSPIFGCILHYNNWIALEKPWRAVISLVWIVGGTSLWLLFGLYGSSTEHAAAAGFMWLVLWYFTSALPQIGYVRRHFGDTYRRKSFVTPLCVAALLLAALLGTYHFYDYADIADHADIRMNEYDVETGLPACGSKAARDGIIEMSENSQANLLYGIHIITVTDMRQFGVNPLSCVGEAVFSSGESRIVYYGYRAVGSAGEEHVMYYKVPSL